MGKYLSKDDYGSGDSWTPDNVHGSKAKIVTISQTYLNADKIYAELISSGEDWADKDAAANLLEEGKHSLLSKLINEIRFPMIEGAYTPTSRIEAEEKARASKDYQDYLAGMVEARRIANRARVRYQAIQTLAELRRSQESTRRQEMRLV